MFHLAAVASVPRSIEEPDYAHEVNLEGTFRVLRAAVDKQVRRVVFAASAAAYGNAPGLPKREDMLPDPQSPYAVQKLAGEAYLRTFGRLLRLETAALRFFNVYGPRQDPSSPYSGVLSIFADCLLAGGRRRFSARASNRATSSSSRTSCRRCCWRRSRRGRWARCTTAAWAAE